MEKVRLTVDVSKELNETLERIAVELGITKAEAFRRAVGLMDISQEAAKHGEYVGSTKVRDNLDQRFVWK